MLQKNKISQTLQEFIKSQQFSGILLIVCTAFSLVISNTHLGEAYIQFWQSSVVSVSVNHFINDVLMAVFLLVGLEIKRELISGELSSFQKASLPFAAALGGMIVPALMYYVFNHGTATASGWGIPMATDIAFALGVLSLMGGKFPLSLKVLLTALAVVDDLGAIVVIAIFYSAQISWMYLLGALITFGILLLMNKMKVKLVLPYLLIGSVLWYFIHSSGIHATIAGVLLGLTIPIGEDEKKSPLHRLEHLLHIPVNYFIMPLFAIANTAIVLEGNIANSFTSTESLGIMLGLILGKPIGICLFVWLACKTKISQWPENAQWNQVIGIGFLAGIGFTMSVFIALLAFGGNQAHELNAKIAILTASFLAGIIGYSILRLSGKKNRILR